MSRNKKSNESNRKYHDRVASRYDSIYDDAYWEFHDRITWNHLKAHLPKLGAPAPQVMDLGCGTGKWGLKLLKAGYATTFSDLSNNMLMEVRKKLEEWGAQADLSSKVARAKVEQADAKDLRGFGEGQFELVTAMGDVVSICGDPGKCLSEVHRILKPGGMFVFTVDNHLAAIDHFISSGNLGELAAFVKTGETEWLTRNVGERFAVRVCTPQQIDSLTKGKGFELVSRIGKTVIPARMNRELFESEGAVEKLVELETILQRDSSAASRASHLQIAARRV